MRCYSNWHGHVADRRTLSNNVYWMQWLLHLELLLMVGSDWLPHPELELFLTFVPQWSVSLHGLSEFSTCWGHTARLTFLCGVLQLTEEIGKLEDKVECANNALKADWERWKQNMQNDLKSAFTDTAEENIRYYEQVSRGSQKPFLVKRCALGCLSALCKDSRGKSQLSPSKASLVTSGWVVSLPHSTRT